MANSIRPRAWVDGDVATVKMLLTHPMETGLRKDKKTGKVIPPHYIQDLVVEHKGKVVVSGMLGPAVSKNPFIQCKFRGAAAGDMLKISWTDNKGESDSIETKIR
jgi:sulfur-oxidizing protein SoxZ